MRFNVARKSSTRLFGGFSRDIGQFPSVDRTQDAMKNRVIQARGGALIIRSMETKWLEDFVSLA
ncbi:MAG TPA: hypothetical protein PKY40_05130, partial [Burkholderiaceae bacterium]|nr:hypothetical protein [Burkholderiaceae bacterium]